RMRAGPLVGGLCRVLAAPGYQAEAGDSGQCGIDRGAPGQFDSLPSSLVTATSSEACADHLTAPSAQEIDLVEVVVPVVRSRSPRCGTAGAVPGLTGSAVGRRGLLGLLGRFCFLRLRLVQVGPDLLPLLGGQRRDGRQRVEGGLDVGVHGACEVAGDHVPPREVALGDALHDDLPLRGALARQDAGLHRLDLLVGQPLRVPRSLLAQPRGRVLDLLDAPVGGFDGLVDLAPQAVQIGQVDLAELRHSTTPTELADMAAARPTLPCVGWAVTPSRDPVPRYASRLT